MCFQGYYWLSKAQFRLGLAIEAFRTIIEGCSKSGNRDNKADLLIEGTIILKTIKGN